MRDLALLVAVASACSVPEQPRGVERAQCYANGTCEGGLLCLSDRCVRPAGADCRLVAQVLTSFELGNYADPQDREPREGQLVLLCQREHLTKEEGQCILTAKTKGELEWCPKPLIAETRVEKELPVPPIGSGPMVGSGGGLDVCVAYVNTLERFSRCQKLPAESARALRQSIAQLKDMYKQYAATAPESMFDSCVMANEATAKAMKQIGC